MAHIYKQHIIQTKALFDFDLECCKVLKFGIQNGLLTVWYLFNEVTNNKHRFKVLPTGSVVDSSWVYIDTYITPAGEVYHIFEKTI